MIGLARTGVVTLEGFRSKRRWAILLIFVGAAILTPPDPVTQCLLALPLVLLFEMGILAAWFGMGSARPAVDWKSKWPMTRNIVVILLLAFLFRDRLYGMWMRSKLDDRVVSEDQNRNYKVNVEAMLRELLGEPMHFAYRAHEQGSEAWILARTDSRVYAVKLVSTNDEPDVTRRSKNSTGEWELVVSTLPQGSKRYELVLAKEVPIRQLRKGLLSGYRYASESNRVGLHELLVKLTGVGEDLDTEQAVLAFEKWFDEQPNGVWIQEVELPKSSQSVPR
jgi:low affinity Fe/Cu permease